MQVIETIVIGVVLLSVLVVIHEFGHYAMARAFKVRVSEFMVGLPGPHIYLFKKGGTAFGLTAYPFGGYARIAGMEPGPEDPLLKHALAYVYRQGATDAEHLAWYLTSSGLLRMPTVLPANAGPDDQVANPADRAEDLLMTLEGWASVVADDSAEFKRQQRAARAQGRELSPRYLAPEDPARGLAAGQPRLVDDEQALIDEQRKGTYSALSYGKRVAVLVAGPVMNILTAIAVLMLILCLNGVYYGSNTLAVVGEGSAAEQAGLVAGDTITGIDGQEVSSWTDVAGAISGHQPGDEMVLTWNREGAEMSATAVLGDRDGSPYLGISPQSVNYKLSVPEAFKATMAYIGQVCVAIVNLFNPFKVQEVLSQSASVVGVAVMAQQAVSQGAASFGSIVAAVSVSLGLMNLLPIPPLDGGKFLVETIQVISRREVSVKVQNYISVAAMALFGLLFVYTLVQDIGRIATGFFGG